MAQFDTNAWQYLHWPVTFFWMHGKDFFFLFFFYIQKEIVKNDA